MRTPIKLILVGALVELCGCASFMRPQPVVLRRYVTQQRAQAADSSVKITVFALGVPATPAPPTNITNLSTDAQAELVKALATRTPNGGPGALAQALAVPIQAASSEPSLRDLTHISRRLVFSLENKSPGEASRISKARIYIDPLDGTRFAGWNRIENNYQTLELGKLSLSQERGATASLGLTLPVAAASPSVGASATNTLQEEVTCSGGARR